MSKKREATVKATPLEVWSRRFNYKPPPAEKKGPYSLDPEGNVLIGKQPYFGPSERVVKKRHARSRGIY